MCYNFFVSLLLAAGWHCCCSSACSTWSGFGKRNVEEKVAAQRYTGVQQVPIWITKVGFFPYYNSLFFLYIERCHQMVIIRFSSQLPNIIILFSFESTLWLLCGVRMLCAEEPLFDGLIVFFFACCCCLCADVYTISQQLQLSTLTKAHSQPNEEKSFFFVKTAKKQIQMKWFCVCVERVQKSKWWCADCRNARCCFFFFIVAGLKREKEAKEQWAKQKIN